MAPKKKKKVLRIVLISLSIILLIAGGFAWWVSANYEGIIKKKLPGWVAKATDSVYHVSVEDVNINLITRNVNITNLNIWPDTSEGGKLRARNAGHKTGFKMTIPEFKASGIHWQDIISDKELNCNNLTITRPVLTIISQPANTLIDTIKKNKGKIEKIAFGNIHVIDPDVTYINNKGEKPGAYHAKGGDIQLDNWRYDPQQPNQKGKMLYADDVQVNLDTIYFKTVDKIYDITIGNIDLSGSRNSLSAKNFMIKTSLSKDAFHSSIGHQKDIYDVNFPIIDVKGIDWQQLQDNSALIIENIDLNRSSVEIYHSRMPKPDPSSKMGNYPNQLIQKLNFPLYVKKVHIADGHFKYTELSNITNEAGSFHIDNMHGTVKHATNIPAYLKDQTDCIISLDGNFMNKSPMTAVFKLSLTDSNGTFIVDGNHKDLDASQIKNVAHTLGNIDINSLYVSSIKFHLEGNEKEARANITMLYKDLKVTIRGKQKDEDNENKEKPVLSLLADALLIHDQNPMPGQEVRTAMAYQKRNPYTSFFNLMWKCIFEGVNKTVLKSDAIANEIAEKKSAGPAKKKSFFKRIFGKKEK